MLSIEMLRMPENPSIKRFGYHNSLYLVGRWSLLFIPLLERIIYNCSFSLAT